MKGFWKSMIQDRTNWLFLAVMGIIFAFGYKAKIEDDPETWFYSLCGIAIMFAIVLILSAVAYHNKNKNGQS